jgi:hypothetical protein
MRTKSHFFTLMERSQKVYINVRKWTLRKDGRAERGLMCGILPAAAAAAAREP